VDLSRHAIDFSLHTNMRGGFELKIPPLFIGIKLSGECTFYISRSGIVTFDEIAVVGIHDAHERRKIGGGAGMKRLPERCRRGGQLGYNVANSFAWLFQTCWFDALRDFKCGHVGRFL
jgi:hypothetical protein